MFWTFLAIYGLLFLAVLIAFATLNLYHHQCTVFLGNNIQFLSSAFPVAVQDGVAFPDKVVCGFVLALNAKFVMRCHFRSSICLQIYEKIVILHAKALNNLYGGRYFLHETGASGSQMRL